MHWNEKGYANECVCVSLFWLFHSRLSGCHCVCLLCDPLRLHPKMMTTFLPDDSHLFFFLCYYIRRPPSSLWMGWQRIRITFQTPIFCCAAAAAAALGGMRIATDSLWSTFSGYHREDEKRRERKTRFFCVYYVFFCFLTDMRARHPAAPSQLAAGCDWISLSAGCGWMEHLPPPSCEMNNESEKGRGRAASVQPLQHPITAGSRTAHAHNSNHGDWLSLLFLKKKKKNK